jgi:cytoskeletal protein RodZ
MNNENPQSAGDARYVFILFGLMFVVLFFAFLIYFIYGQQQFVAQNPDGTPTYTLSDDETVPDIDSLRKGLNDSATTPTPTITVPSTSKTTPSTSTTTTTTTSTNTPKPTPTITTSPIVTNDPAILARYNPRTEATVGLK